MLHVPFRFFSPAKILFFPLHKSILIDHYIDALIIEIVQPVIIVNEQSFGDNDIIMGFAVKYFLVVSIKINGFRYFPIGMAVDFRNIGRWPGIIILAQNYARLIFVKISYVSRKL